MQLVTARGERFDRERLIEVLTELPEVRSIHWSVNRGVAEVTNLPTELLWGEDAIEEEIGGLRFRVRPNAFLQTNTEMAERLYALARETPALTGNETVYDLYCGIGTIGLSVAGARDDGVGHRDQRGVGRVRDRERRAELDRQRRLLRRERRRGADRAARRAPATPTSWSSTRRAPGLAGQGAEAARRDRGAAGRLRVVQPDDARGRRRSASPTTTATGSCARGRSTCSRTRRTSSASRCSSETVPLTSWVCKACGTQYPAERRAARRLRDLRGPAPVHPGRRGPGVADVATTCATRTRPRSARTHGMLGDRHDAVVRDRPARAARQERGRQRALGLHRVSRRRHHPRESRPRAGSPRSRSRIRTTTRRWSSGRTRSPARSCCTRTDSEADVARPDPAVRPWGGETHDARRRPHAHPLRRPLRRRRRYCTGATAAHPASRATSCR